MIQTLRRHLHHVFVFVKLDQRAIGGAWFAEKSEGGVDVPKSMAACLRCSAESVEIHATRFKRLRLECFIAEAMYTSPSAKFANIRAAVYQQVAWPQIQKIQMVVAGQFLYAGYHAPLGTVVPVASADVKLMFAVRYAVDAALFGHRQSVFLSAKFVPYVDQFAENICGEAL
ncbi:hypothetical protein ASE36_10660 [Rhizobium sp. Root274]|nr:hypothetical protein ASC71_10675 [Rhizobium sp. Root1240]KRD29133.1 hypothetical protein ASE36_10660 [Rhizobium sp. Root274]